MFGLLERLIFPTEKAINKVRCGRHQFFVVSFEQLLISSIGSKLSWDEGWTLTLQAVRKPVESGDAVVNWDGQQL